MINDEFTLPEDNSSEGSYEAQRYAVMKSFEDKHYAKRAFHAERQRLETIREEVKVFVVPDDESAAQYDFEYIVDEATREIGSLENAEPLITSNVDEAGKVFFVAKDKRIELEGLLARIKGLHL